jgi:hypothetical protein
MNFAADALIGWPILSFTMISRRIPDMFPVLVWGLGGCRFQGRIIKIESAGYYSEVITRIRFYFLLLAFQLHPKSFFIDRFNFYHLRFFLWEVLVLVKVWMLLLQQLLHPKSLGRLRRSWLIPTLDCLLFLILKGLIEKCLNGNRPIPINFGCESRILPILRFRDLYCHDRDPTDFVRSILLQARSSLAIDKTRECILLTPQCGN